VNFKFFLISSFFFLIIFGRVLVDPACASLPWQDHKIRVSVYVVALDGVEAREVANVTRVVEGVRGAVEALNKNNLTIELPFLRYWKNFSKYFLHKGEGAPPFDDMTYVYASFPANASLHIINEWDDYRNVVEHSVETIIVNAHGAVLPVPNGYTKEAWTDKIAEAMLLRNVTWVHVGGYPLYYAWRQGASTAEHWGKTAFQRLMQHINKGNVRIPPYTGTEVAAITSRAEIDLRHTWRLIYEAMAVTNNYPLTVQDFKEHEAFPIWTLGNYYAGVALAFKTQANTTSHGFYVHIGTNQTFGEVPGGLEPTDADFYRGYIGGATGLWILVSRTARETLIVETETLIQKAIEEGRTKGLQEAQNHLQYAKHLNQLYFGTEFFVYAYEAMLAASTAQKPKSDPLPLLFTGMSLSIIAIISGAILYKRKNNKEESM